MLIKSISHEFDQSKFKLLKTALLESYPDQDSLQMLMFEELGVNLALISKPANLEVTIFNLINWAKANDRLENLISGALAQRPRNRTLISLAELFELNSDAAQFERIIRKSIPLTNVEQWRALMVTRERAVCRIEAPAHEGWGTGFLISSNIVITNFHVIDEISKRGLTADKLVLRFDYKCSPDGATLDRGQAYTLRTDNWKPLESPIAELDYALLAVEGEPGQGRVMDGGSSATRGWVSPGSGSISKGDPLFIIQHPSASPMKFSTGTVLGFQSVPTRILYDANTEAGSSGSPCFAADWGIVGLHHYGGMDHNRGVSFQAITQDIRNRLGNLSNA